MSLEALLLALTAIVRPSSTAALIAILSARRPQRLLMAYVLAGAAFSLAVGWLVVVAVQGFGPTASSATRRPLIDDALGVAALSYAAAVGIGWLPRPRDTSTTASPTWMRRRLQDMSRSGAAIAGVLTHLPGLVYLAALNAIVSVSTGTLNAAIQVLVYNAIWFSMPIAALVLSVHRPTESRERLAQLTAWGQRHRRVITVLFFGGLGTYLLVGGLLA